MKRTLVAILLGFIFSLVFGTTVLAAGAPEYILVGPVAGEPAYVDIGTGSGGSGPPDVNVKIPLGYYVPPE